MTGDEVKISKSCQCMNTPQQFYKAKFPGNIRSLRERMSATRREKDITGRRFLFFISSFKLEFCELSQNFVKSRCKKDEIS